MHYALKDYGADLQWNVGTLFCHDKVLFRLVSFCTKFEVPIPVKWAFGCIPSLMGSGMAVPTVHTQMDAVGIIERHLECGIACRLALTNPHVDSKMIQSDKVNLGLIKFLNESVLNGCQRNGIIVSSDVLAECVKESYPNLDVILSVIRPAYDVGYGRLNDTLEWYAEKLENPLYDIVEVNNSKLHEDGFLESLPSKDKVELIACRDCIRNCPFTKHHFESALGVMKKLDFSAKGEKAKLMLDEVSKMCVCHRMKHLDQASSYDFEDIKRLASLGYRRFQISCRRNTDERIEQDISEYMFSYKHLRYLENLE